MSTVHVTTAYMTAPDQPTSRVVPFTGRTCLVDVQQFYVAGPRRKYFDSRRKAFRVVVTGDTAGLTGLRISEQTTFTVVPGSERSEGAARKGARRLAVKVADRLRPQLTKQGVKLQLGTELTPRVNHK